MNALLTLVEGFTILTLVKVLIVILLGVYTIFAGLMMTQVMAMTKAVVIKDGFIMKILSLVHFLFAMLVLLLALFIL